MTFYDFSFRNSIAIPPPPPLPSPSPGKKIRGVKEEDSGMIECVSDWEGEVRVKPKTKRKKN